MKLLSAAALALMAIAPTMASATAFSVNFEKVWDFNQGDINGYYNGGTAADGTSGPNLGVQFVNVSGLSNDPSFPAYSGAPSPLGVAYAFRTTGSYLNVASGVTNALGFFYSSPVAVSGAVKAYSGLNGSGSMLGSINLLSTFNPTTSAYDAWSFASFGFAGVARSFDLSASAVDSAVAFDNIATVPEPGTVLMLLVGGTALATLRRRRA